MRGDDGKIIEWENGDQKTMEVSNPDYDENYKKYGIIAQEVVEVLKKYNKEGKFRGINTSNPDRYHADYLQFIAPIMKAIQELSFKVEVLENE